MDFKKFVIFMIVFFGRSDITYADAFAYAIPYDVHGVVGINIPIRASYQYSFMNLTSYNQKYVGYELLTVNGLKAKRNISFTLPAHEEKDITGDLLTINYKATKPCTHIIRASIKITGHYNVANSNHALLTITP